MLNRLKQFISGKLRKRLESPDMAQSLFRLSKFGFVPKHAIDVGAYHGDFAAMLLDVWPNCLVSCFEPQPGKQAKIQERFFGNQRVKVLGDLLSSRTGEELTLSLVETASSVLSEHVAKHAKSKAFQSVALDDWWERGGGMESPDFIKLDVQGFELEVLKGAERLLPKVEVIVAEVNLLDIHKDVPLVHEVSNWLADRGFVAFDVAGLTRRPLDRALWQMDLVFVRRDGRFRMDKRWAASAE